MEWLAFASRRRCPGTFHLTGPDYVRKGKSLRGTYRLDELPGYLHEIAVDLDAAPLSTPPAV